MLVLMTPEGPSMLMFLYSTSASATFESIQSCFKRVNADLCLGWDQSDFEEAWAAAMERSAM